MRYNGHNEQAAREKRCLFSDGRRICCAAAHVSDAAQQLLYARRSQVKLDTGGGSSGISCSRWVLRRWHGVGVRIRVWERKEERGIHARDLIPKRETGVFTILGSRSS